jgi:diguanylate cyclase (GGDEF)-like protein/PAS domain S-box-containing protein
LATTRNTAVSRIPPPADATPWRYAMEGLGQGLWDWRVQSDTVYYSREYMAILGYAEGELPQTADTWVSRVHPDDLTRAEADLAAHLENRSPMYWNEHRLRCKDGSYKWVLERGKIIEWTGDGRPSRVIGSLSDIHRRKMAELALRESEQLFREIFDHAPIGLALVALDLRWLDVNQALCRMLGYEERELLQLRVSDLTHPDDRAAEEQLLAEALTGKRLHASREKRYIHRLGGIVHAQVDTSLLRDDKGEPRYMISQIENITERRRYQDALREEKELAQITLAGIADAVIRCDTQGRISYANEAALRLLGRHASQLVGAALKDCVQLFGDRGGKRLPDPLQSPADARKALAPIAQLLSANEELRPVEYNFTRLHGHDGKALGSILVLHDLTHTRMLSDQLIYQASHDPLTGLPNRREFEAELAHHLETAHSGAMSHCLLYIDLDQFKLVNDTCGHPAGDRLLRELAAELKSATPPGALLSRLGGDEFALILPQTEPAAAVAVAEHIAEVVRSFRFVYDERSFQIGSSIGISVIDAQSASAHRIMSQADTACYVAKRLGRGRVQLYQASDEDVRQTHAEMDWASRIEEALSGSRIALHAQRIVALDGNSSACEILLRVREDDGSFSTPEAFLKAADGFGLSTRIDRWVVQQALGALQAHLRRHGRLPFEYASINLSGSSISDEEFARYLLRLLSRSEVPAACIAFEITESAAFSSVHRARTFVETLRSRGYRILLDDFGSGFTSFEHLRRIGVDGLKIEMAYTRDLVNDAFNRSIVEFICRIGKQLGLQVIAEGVEDRDTLAALRILGAHRAQGHLFHCAQPLPEFLTAQAA